MTDSESPHTLPATTDETPPPRPRRLWPLWTVIVLLAAILAALMLWSWQQWQASQSLEQQVSQLSKVTDRLDRRASETDNAISGRIDTLQNQLSRQQETLAEQARQIDHNARTLLEAGNRTRTDWLMAEAEYLLRIANQRLQIERDFEGALSALKSADEVLASTDNPGIFPVRKEIAREILSLKAIEGVDRTGLYLTLEAAIDTVSNLTDAALTERDETLVGERIRIAEEQNREREGALSQGWNRLLQSLDDAVTIRRLDESVEPLLSPRQSAYARLNLRLMLEEAEMAVLRGHQELYDRALNKASTWLGDWYDASHPPVRALTKTLNELSERNINPELPDISDSLYLLKARLEGRLQASQQEESSDTEESSEPGTDKTGAES